MKPSIQWLNDHCHELNDEDLLLVAKAFLAKGTLETKNVEDFFPTESEKLCSPYFLRKQIPNSAIDIQEKVDELNFQKNFASFKSCSAFYKDEKQNAENAIAELHAEMDALIFSDFRVDSKKFRKFVLNIRQEETRLRARVAELELEIKYLEKEYEDAVTKFLHTDRLKILQIFDDMRMIVILAPVEWPEA